MIQNESQLFSNISATTDNFPLLGGVYQVAVIGTSFGTVTFEQLGPDGSTYLNVDAAYSANGGGTYFIPPGLYRFAISSTTAVYAEVKRISVN